MVNTFLGSDWGLGKRETVSNSLRRYSNMQDRLADNKGKINDKVMRDIYDLTLMQLRLVNTKDMDEDSSTGILYRLDRG